MTTPSGTRSLWTTLATIVVVAFAASLIGCASAGPLTPIVVSAVKSVVGTWTGVVYQSGSEPNDVVLTIQDDGSYHVESRQALGPTHGRGTIVVRGGRLIFESENGRGVGRVLRSRSGDRVMDVEATLSDNTTVTAKLSPSP